MLVWMWKSEAGWLLVYFQTDAACWPVLTNTKACDSTDTLRPGELEAILDRARQVATAGTRSCSLARWWLLCCVCFYWSRWLFLENQVTLAMAGTVDTEFALSSLHSHVCLYPPFLFVHSVWLELMSMQKHPWSCWAHGVMGAPRHHQWAATEVDGADK